MKVSCSRKFSIELILQITVIRKTFTYTLFYVFIYLFIFLLVSVGAPRIIFLIRPAKFVETTSELKVH